MGQKSGNGSWRWWLLSVDFNIICRVVHWYGMWCVQPWWVRAVSGSFFVCGVGLLGLVRLTGFFKVPFFKWRVVVTERSAAAKMGFGVGVFVWWASPASVILFIIWSVVWSVATGLHHWCWFYCLHYIIWVWCHQKSFLCVPLYSFLARCHKIFLLIIGIIGTRYGVFQCTVSFFGNVQSMAIFSSALFARLGVL